MEGSSPGAPVLVLNGEPPNPIFNPKGRPIHVLSGALKSKWESQDGTIARTRQPNYPSRLLPASTWKGVFPRRTKLLVPPYCIQHEGRHVHGVGGATTASDVSIYRDIEVKGGGDLQGKRRERKKTKRKRNRHTASFAGYLYRVEVPRTYPGIPPAAWFYPLG